jgi:hypothetical protein
VLFGSNTSPFGATVLHHPHSFYTTFLELLKTDHVVIDAASDGAVATRMEAINVAICADTVMKSMSMAIFVEETVSGGCVLVGGGEVSHHLHCLIACQ